ncbi:MAG: endonuclease III [Candidatus Aenigmarchaeota archaeon]|nr:endonuclease III [Candidatus Aenigmarchaeota archaeon]
MGKINVLLKFLEKRYGYPEFSRNKFKLLITTVLSQRTRDENTYRASKNLFSVVNGPEDILKLPLKNLKELIKPSGMYRQKAERIKKICKILVKEYGGKVPNTREELMKLPGVGYKTADIVLSYGFGVPTIAVDTHVNRIPKRIGIVRKDATVEEVRKTMEKYVKGRKRFLVNIGLVRFGQEICRPVRPKCEICPINKICDYYKSLYNKK